MKRRKSILGIVLTCCYLICTVVLIEATACGTEGYFIHICGRILGALAAALPWTLPFFNDEGQLYVMIIASVAGIAVNAFIIYLCGWAVERTFRFWRSS